jgi:hypothetical protein
LVDVSGVIEKFRAYAPLRRSPELFRQVKLGEYGTDVVWPDAIDMSADLLWHLSQEQSGATMSAEDFRGWRERQGYTLDAAAKALGISRRMLAYYESGDHPIPASLRWRQRRWRPDRLIGGQWRNALRSSTVRPLRLFGLSYRLRATLFPEEQWEPVVGFLTVRPETAFSKHSLGAGIPSFCVEPTKIQRRLNMTDERWPDALPSKIFGNDHNPYTCVKRIKNQHACWQHACSGYPNVSRDTPRLHQFEQILVILWTTNMWLEANSVLPPSKITAPGPGHRQQSLYGEHSWSLAYARIGTRSSAAFGAAD